MLLRRKIGWVDAVDSVDFLRADNRRHRQRRWRD
jgi:hypothetical protein